MNETGIKSKQQSCPTTPTHKKFRRSHDCTFFVFELNCCINIIHDQSVSDSLVVLNLHFGRESFGRQLLSESPPSVILKQELDNPYMAFSRWLTGQTLVRQLPDLSLQPCYGIFYSCGFHAFISHLQKTLLSKSYS